MGPTKFIKTPQYKITSESVYVLQHDLLHIYLTNTRGGHDGGYRKLIWKNASDTARDNLRISVTYSEIDIHLNVDLADKDRICFSFH